MSNITGIDPKDFENTPTSVKTVLCVVAGFLCFFTVLALAAWFHKGVELYISFLGLLLLLFLVGITTDFIADLRRQGEGSLKNLS